MFNMKAVFATLLVGSGAAAMAVAVHSQSPGSFTSRVAPPLPLPEAPVVVVEQLPMMSEPPELMTPMKPAPPPPRGVRPRPELPSTPPAPACNGWRGLESGPEGRLVRELCPSEVQTSVQAQTVPGS